MAGRFSEQLNFSGTPLDAIPASEKQEAEWKLVLQYIETSISEIPGTAVIFRKFKAAYLAEQRFRALLKNRILSQNDETIVDYTVELEDGEASSYYYSRAIRSLEIGIRLAKAIEGRQPAVAQYIGELVGGFQTVKHTVEDNPDLKQYFGGKKNIVAYELLKNIANKTKNGARLSNEEFIALSRFLTTDSGTQQAVFIATWLVTEAGRAEDNLNSVLSREEARPVEVIVRLMCQYGTQLLEGIADADSEVHAASREVLSLLFMEVSALGDPVGNNIWQNLVIGAFVRDMSGKLDYGAWLKELEQNAEFESDPWYRVVYTSIRERIAISSLYSIWASDLQPVIFSPLIHEVRPVRQRRGLAELIPAIAQQPKTFAYMDVEVPIYLLSNDKAFNHNVSLVRIMARTDKDQLVGSLYFGEATADSPDEIQGFDQVRAKIRFSIDLNASEPKIQWNLADFENFAPNAQHALDLAVTDLLDAHVGTIESASRSQVSSKSTTSSMHKPMMAGPSMRRGDSQPAPAPHKRRARSRSGPQMSPNITFDNPENFSAYTKTLKEEQLKPVFVWNEAGLDDMLRAFDEQSKKLIEKKLIRQKTKRTSRVKSYPYEPDAPNGRPVVTMRVNRSIRIFAEWAEVGNTAEVYKVERKP